ncbi:DUF3052 family protein [bacterium]|nr:DUF3052 family protein [bacterium]
MALSLAGSAPAGPSGKPLLKKLGWRPGQAAVALAAPNHYADLVCGAPIEAVSEAPADRMLDFIHVFVRRRQELHAMLADLERQLASGGMIWVSWPKTTSALHEDLNEDGVRAEALTIGLVDIKVCAVDDDWSALKLTRRRRARAA